MYDTEFLLAITRLNENIERLLGEPPKVYPRGLECSNAKIANIYHVTGAIIAEGVCISEWANEHGYCRSMLGKTARANRDLPHNHKNNPHIYRGIYARYVD